MRPQALRRRTARQLAQHVLDAAAGMSGRTMGAQGRSAGREDTGWMPAAVYVSHDRAEYQTAGTRAAPEIRPAPEVREAGQAAARQRTAGHEFGQPEAGS
jgi:hypothetical protein